MINLIQNIDISCIEFLYKIQHNLKSDIINKTMIFFTNLGDNGIIWIMISLILLCTKKIQKIRNYISNLTNRMLRYCKSDFKTSCSQTQTF